MRRFPGVFVFLFLLLAAPICSVAAPDSKLLSMVPPGAQIVAGIDSQPPKGEPGSFVLITHNNSIDLRDFFALTGVDSTRVVHHAVFVAMDTDTGHLDEHSFLVKGHFDRERIYQSALEGGARVTNYRGIPVLIVLPFAREQGEFNEPRWFAIVDSDLLFFGSIASVRQELDRHLDGSAADPVLIQKLARLRHDDETWCLMTAPARNSEVRDALMGLDPKLAELAGDGDMFQFGIRYRKQVEFEYEVTTASGPASHTISESLLRSLTRPAKGSSFLADNEPSEDSRTVRSEIKIPRTQFGAWLEKVSDHTR